MRRVKKITQAQPGDQVEIITRPDGTKVRRIRRAKKADAINNGSPSLGSHLGSTGTLKKGSSASVPSDFGLGEVYTRADGKK